VVNLHREIRRRTLTYAIGALFLVVLLSSVIHNFGVQIETSFDMGPTPNENNLPDSTPSPEPTLPPFPNIPPEPNFPPVPTSPPEPIVPVEFSNLKTFSSRQELEIFLEVGMEEAKQFQSIPQFGLFDGGVREAVAGDAQAMAPEAGTDYSTTNIQVEGVDEADIVKSDGEFLYVVSGSSIYLLKVFPPNQAVLLSKIDLEENYGSQIYLNGDKLVVLGNRNWNIMYGVPEGIAVAEDSMRIAPYYYQEEMFVKVYDVSDRSNPVLTRTVFVNGTVSGSRMIGDYVYAVINQPITAQRSNQTGFDVVLPKISGDHVLDVQPEEIRYIDAPDYYYRLTSIVAVDVMDDSLEPTYESFLAGYSSNMYVSLNNLYLVVPNTNIWMLRESGDIARDETLIFRIKLDQEKIVAMAEGSVSGYVLNQFSMDEFDGFFRVATTEWTVDGSINNLFVLDMNMSVVGKLGNLAKGEQIYSARFMGDRCYLVTFRQIDPFFVIDLADPTDPNVLGYLKIPGFSGYLHPYDQNYIIGLGKQDNNLKLSLFDVTDVTSPIEKAKYVVSGDWSDSMALWDSKAFLFDKSKQLLALPVSVNSYNRILPGTYWQGAYVFGVTLEQGFNLEGTITHLNPIDQYNGGLEVKRILYIEDILYTVSDKMVKINDLESLNPIEQLELS
jgi:uncharacterized secreted protein with C-terminal beta-propeller domain